MNIPISMKHMKMKIFPPRDVPWTARCISCRSTGHADLLASERHSQGFLRWLMDVNGYEEWLEYGYIIIKSWSAVVNSTVVNSN